MNKYILGFVLSLNMVLAENLFAGISADSLFQKKEYTKAKLEYLKILSQNSYNPNVLLKLAYISGQEGEIINEAFFLSEYDKKNANEKVMTHLANLGKEHNWSGYEKNDINYFLLIYRKFAPYLILFLIVIGIYVFGVLIHKKLTKQFMPTRHKTITFIYLILLLAFVNISNNYRSVIVKQDDVILRSYPSSAAPTLGTISKGNRLNWLNSDDIWLQVLWNNQLVYLKQADVLKIE